MEEQKQSLGSALQQKVDEKTKPLGALGMLEALAKQAGEVQQTENPELKHPHIVVFAGDHGIAKEGVSAYPQEVTYQMVYNFLSGGAAINVLSSQNGILLKIVDAGVNHDFEGSLKPEDCKVGYGTRSFLSGPAMTEKELEKCLEKGKQIVEEVAATGCNVIGFGEMGIGNTTSASMIMSKLCNIDPELCVGRGTGVDDERMQVKANVLKEAAKKHAEVSEPKEILQTFGGFEMAQMCGAMLAAAERRMLVLVDGFIASAAFLVASAINPEIHSFAVFCHRSDEQGHRQMLDFLEARPILDLGMRLGEGTGCAVAYPVLQSAVTFLNEMASFADAGVSDK